MANVYFKCYWSLNCRCYVIAYRWRKQTKHVFFSTLPLRPNSYVEVIPHWIKLKYEKLSEGELMATLLGRMNTDEI